MLYVPEMSHQNPWNFFKRKLLYSRCNEDAKVSPAAIRPAAIRNTAAVHVVYVRMFRS